MMGIFNFKLYIYMYVRLKPNTIELKLSRQVKLKESQPYPDSYRD